MMIMNNIHERIKANRRRVSSNSSSWRKDKDYMNSENKDLAKDRRRKEERQDREKDVVHEKHNENEREGDKERKERRDKERDKERKDRSDKERKDRRVNNRDKEEKGEKRGNKDNDRTRDKDFAKDGENDSQLLENQRLNTDVLSLVSRSRKLEEERSSEKEKALQLARIFEEQDNVNYGDSEDDDAAVEHTSKDIGGVKILHGLDIVLAGGAVFLTLKDQSILADEDINEEVDMLESEEIREQKRRDEAYKAGKRKTGVYDDMFSDEPGVEKRMIPQYDDPIADEGVTLDSCGRFTGEAERKLEELRKRTQGVSAISHRGDLNSSVMISTDYLTQEETMKFKRPTKKKSLRKREKLDMNTLEAEAASTGLGNSDLGSRNHRRRQNMKEVEDRIDAARRSHAYQSACAKAEEASKALRQGSMRTAQAEKDDMLLFGDDDDELRKSLESVRKIALKKQNEEEKSVLTPLLAISSTADNYVSGEQQENKVIFTEMEEFLLGFQKDEETQKPGSGDVCMDEVLAPIVSDQEMKDEDGVWAAVETVKADAPKKESVVLDQTIHESAIGRGVAATLKLLRERGSLNETVEWGGRNTDKNKSKLVGLSDGNAKAIHIERVDEHGRILTPKEAFRRDSHVFHGKKPGKRKQEKLMRQYLDEQKVKRMNNADTPSLSAQRMREAQATQQTPFLVLS